MVAMIVSARSKEKVNIGEAAAQSGVPAKTIRYYEEIGLIQPARRADNGYRAYHAIDVHMLRFVQRARSLGFSVRDCRQLLQLYQDPHRASADVKALAEAVSPVQDKGADEGTGRIPGPFKAFGEGQPPFVEPESAVVANAVPRWVEPRQNRGMGR